ncbi:MAG: hypothetical protein N2510_04495 [Ignavibacteria bacterium]|nr:hypothetical protein [Ignavibacteria bacterium]
MIKEIKNGTELSKILFELMKESPWLKINCYSAYYLHKLASDRQLDFIMVQSTRDEPFDLFVNEVSSLLNLMLKNPGREIYAYRIRGKDHILKYPLIDRKTSEFMWVEKDLIIDKSKKFKGYFHHNLYKNKRAAV